MSSPKMSCNHGLILLGEEGPNGHKRGALLQGPLLERMNGALLHVGKLGSDIPRHAMQK